MQSLRPRRPSPALVISLIALIVALGGTSYAAMKLPKNSVGTKQLKKNAVTGVKIKKKAVTGAKVKDHSLTGADINLAQLGTVPSATNAAHAGLADRAGNAAHATSADRATNATNASQAANASKLDGLSSDQFVQGAGTTVTARTTLGLGGGGLQHIVTVSGFGEVVGGCGSGGAAVGFVNHSGHDLRVFPFAGGDQSPVTVSDGNSSGLFPSGVGSAGYTMLQIGSTDFTDQRLLTVIASRDAQAANRCPVQAWAITR